MIPCVGLASGIGAGNPGCGDGPVAIKKEIPELDWKGFIHSGPMSIEKPDSILSSNQALAMMTQFLAKQGIFFVIFGGDHSCGIGTWSGVAEAKREEGEIGLIWIDAHMDAHTPQTTPTGNFHGMPVAALLGSGDQRLTSILSAKPKVQYSNLILIGIRSFEEEEAAFLKAHGVKIYYIEEVADRGFATVLQEAVADLSSRCCGYGVSFDLDVIDPQEVQAVGTPVSNGVGKEEFFSSFSVFETNPPIAFEIVEYNPHLDNNGMTMQFIRDLVNHLKKLCTGKLHDSCRI